MVRAKRGHCPAKRITRPSRTFAAYKAANQDDPYMSHGAEMRIVSTTAPMRTTQRAGRDNRSDHFSRICSFQDDRAHGEILRRAGRRTGAGTWQK
jgi:hypothetical protein